MSEDRFAVLGEELRKVHAQLAGYLDSLSRAATGVLEAPLAETDGMRHQIVFWKVTLLRTCIATAHKSATELLLVASEARKGSRSCSGRPPRRPSWTWRGGSG